MDQDPTLDKHLKFSKKSLSLFFYKHNVMPCCMLDRKFLTGDQGGNCQNIQCFHCGHKWNINKNTKFIQNISPERELLTEKQKLELKNG